MVTKWGEMLFAEDGLLDVCVEGRACCSTQAPQKETMVQSEKVQDLSMRASLVVIVFTFVSLGLLGMEANDQP
jgi:hypothetical protein